MIVLNLLCVAGHRFEGWFASVEAFDQQSDRQQITCPYCSSTQLKRLPSGPYVVRGSSSLASRGSIRVGNEQTMDFIKQLADSCEDVGTRFAEEARRIHYDEAPIRQIKGVATIVETLDLIEEGIAVIPLLSPPKDETH
jgi:hypothetical protein